MQTYQGSCHCGLVTFEVDGEVTEGMSCNCSHCKRKGMLLAFIPESQFRLLSGAQEMTHYFFNKKTIDHSFCKTCGVQPFGRSGDTIAVNLNCIADEDLDTSSLKIVPVDGKSF